MAALSNTDLIRILGEDAQAQIEAASAEKSDNPILLRRKRLQKIENAQFSASALILMGTVLFVSAYYTQTGQSFQIQSAVAGAVLVAGALWHVVLGAQKRRL
jgi:hypothetical protein